MFASSSQTRWSFNHSQLDTVRLFSAAGMAMFVLCACGCNPVTTGAKIGVRIVGDVVEDTDVKERAKALVGQPIAKADEMFGEPVDVFKEIHSDRRWHAYPVKLDILNRQRYVVEDSGGRIVAVSKAEKSDRKIDIPRVLILKEKVKGKPPRECEVKLDMGRPLIAARSEKTGRLVQVYDAGMITDLGTPHYCIVRYDEKDLCDDVDFVAIGASTKKGGL